MTVLDIRFQRISIDLWPVYMLKQRLTPTPTSEISSCYSLLLGCCLFVFYHFGLLNSAYVRSCYMFKYTFPLVTSDL